MGKNSALANMLVVGAMPFVGVGLALFANAAVHSSPAAVLTRALALLGGVLLLVSKMPRFVAGRAFSFGTNGLPAWARRAYVCAYAALFLSIAGLVVVLRA